MTIAHALTAIGFTGSNGEAKRKIAEGAVRLNDEVVSDPTMAAAVGKLSLGKKKHGLLVA
jgi:tyrosyl-tRNA synthetase